MKRLATLTAQFAGPRWVLPALNIVLAVAGAAAVAVLILEYGFREAIVNPSILHAIAAVIVAVFVLDRIVRLVLSRAKKVYFRENWIDFAMMLVAASAAAIAWRVYGKVLGAGALYVLITQVYILVALVLRAAGVNLMFADSGIHPMWLLIGSFAFFCLAGSGLLMLPVASNPGAGPLYYLDALFTATSATCVTGLITKGTGTDFSPFGQAVILSLIQLGGLGIMLFGTVLAMLVGKGLSVRGSAAVGGMMGARGVGEIPRILKFVVLVTFVVELLGAMMLFEVFKGAPDTNGATMGTAKAIWYSVFHSISCFCNAGFSLYDNNMMAGVGGAWRTAMRDRWQVLGVMAPLIILGGLGFPVLMDCGRYVRGLLARAAHRTPGLQRADTAGRPPVPRLTLHSKIVLASSVVLLAFGALGLLLVEPPAIRPDREQKRAVGGHGPFRGDYKNTLADWPKMDDRRRLREALFLSVSARTAGFNTVDVGELSDAGKLWLCGLMVVGGSPAGTAGGIKTVTIVLLIFVIWSTLRRRKECEVFRRSIAPEIVRRATAVVLLYLLLLATITVLLSISMRDRRFIDVLFEACSACGTVGLSAGLTGAGHGEMTRLVTIAGMFLGRLGPITLLLALTSRMTRAEYAYPRENVLIG